MAVTIGDLFAEYEAGCGQEAPARTLEELRELWRASGLRHSDYPTPPAFWTLVFGREDDAARWGDGSLDWPSEAQWAAYLAARPHDDPTRRGAAEPGLGGAEIRARREALGLTREQLSRALDTTQNTIYRWEAGLSDVAHPGMLRLALAALERRQEETMHERVTVSSPVPGADIEVTKRYTWRHRCPRARQALDADAAHRVASAGGALPDAVLTLARYLIDGGGAICPNTSAIGITDLDDAVDRDGYALEWWYSAHDALPKLGPGADLDPHEMPPVVHVRVWRAMRGDGHGAYGRVRLTCGEIDETYDVTLSDALPLLAESAAPARLRLLQLVDRLDDAVRARWQAHRERELASATRREERRNRAR